MTEVREVREMHGAGNHDDGAITDALRLIDEGLSGLLHRELMSTDEVSNLLLDVRSMLTSLNEQVEDVDQGEPVGA
ncbi:MAG: hypothetical protein AB7L84_04530 [Acidimicrobiia bacterium]